MYAIRSYYDARSRLEERRHGGDVRFDGEVPRAADGIQEEHEKRHAHADDHPRASDSRDDLLRRVHLPGNCPHVSYNFV